MAAVEEARERGRYSHHVEYDIHNITGIIYANLNNSREPSCELHVHTRYRRDS